MANSDLRGRWDRHRGLDGRNGAPNTEATHTALRGVSVWGFNNRIAQFTSYVCARSSTSTPQGKHSQLTQNHINAHIPHRVSPKSQSRVNSRRSGGVGAVGGWRHLKPQGAANVRVGAHKTVCKCRLCMHVRQVSSCSRTHEKSDHGLVLVLHRSNQRGGALRAVLRVHICSIVEQNCEHGTSELSHAHSCKTLSSNTAHLGRCPARPPQPDGGLCCHRRRARR